MAETAKIENLKLSERSSIEISTIKKHTKIETMNVICRWAFTVSLSSDLPPPPLAKEDKINNFEKNLKNNKPWIFND